MANQELNKYYQSFNGYGVLKSKFGGDYGYTSITGSYVASIIDKIIDVTTTSFSASITLPSSTSVWNGKSFFIKDVSGSSETNGITILTNGNDTIDGLTARVINIKYGDIEIYSNGINKYFIRNSISSSIFSVNGTISTAFNSSTISSTGNAIAWRAPFRCSVTGFYGYISGTSGSKVNARLNGASNHLSSDLTLTATDSWISYTGTLQNILYNPGDKLEIMLTTLVDSPSQIAIQVDFLKK
jgi:hypothetical protein